MERGGFLTVKVSQVLIRSPNQKVSQEKQRKRWGVRLGLMMVGKLKSCFDGNLSNFL